MKKQKELDRLTKELVKQMTGNEVEDPQEVDYQIAYYYLSKAMDYTRCCDKLPKSDIILARYLHDSYELIAKKQDWNTQENCKVDFSDLPIENKNTMIFLAGKIIQDFGGN
jgi:hypothetical protein